jgi:hypothetical protein
MDLTVSYKAASIIKHSFGSPFCFFSPLFSGFQLLLRLPYAVFVMHISTEVLLLGNRVATTSGTTAVDNIEDV